MSLDPDALHEQYAAAWHDYHETETLCELRLAVLKRAIDEWVCPNTSRPGDFAKLNDLAHGLVVGLGTLIERHVHICATAGACFEVSRADDIGQCLLAQCKHLVAKMALQLCRGLQIQASRAFDKDFCLEHDFHADFGTPDLSPDETLDFLYGCVNRSVCTGNGPSRRGAPAEMKIFAEFMHILHLQRLHYFLLPER